MDQPQKIQFQFAALTINPGSVSDDTNMTLALLKTLIKDKFKYIENHVILAYMEFAEKQKWMMGKNTKALFKGVKTVRGYIGRVKKHIDHMVKSQSNGTLMRASPLVFADNISRDHALSNPNDVNRDVNVVFVHVLREIHQCKSKEQIRESLLKITPSIAPEVREAVNDSFTLGKRNVSGKHKGWVCNSLSVALSAFWHFEDFSEAMKFIVTIPDSDPDTNGSIAGALIGSYLGYAKMMVDDKTRHNIKCIDQTLPELREIMETTRW